MSARIGTRTGAYPDVPLPRPISRLHARHDTRLKVRRHSGTRTCLEFAPRENPRMEPLREIGSGLISSRTVAKLILRSFLDSSRVNFYQSEHSRVHINHIVFRQWLLSSNCHCSMHFNLQSLSAWFLNDPVMKN